jgi:CxxC motif-containing protein
MKKEIICIECPKGCPLDVDIENGKVISVSGNKCPKGNEYAQAEIENPRRILTSSVLCEGLDIRMLPVRTDQPIPKAQLMEAMEAVKKIRVTKPVKAGDVIAADFFGTHLISTRDIQTL